MTAASAEKQIDELDERLFRVRSGAEVHRRVRRKAGLRVRGQGARGRVRYERVRQPVRDRDRRGGGGGQGGRRDGHGLLRAQEGGAQVPAATPYSSRCGGGDAPAPEPQPAEAPIRLSGPVVAALSRRPTPAGRPPGARAARQARHALAAAMSAAPLHRLGLVLTGFHARARGDGPKQSPATPATSADTAEGSPRRWPPDAHGHGGAHERLRDRRLLRHQEDDGPPGALDGHALRPM